MLQRTAENKFLRLNIDTADELSAGFPKTRAELFAIREEMLRLMREFRGASSDRED